MNYHKWVEETMQRVIKKLEKTAPAIGPRCPHMTEGGDFNEEIISWWTNGFWPGLLWLMYQQTKNDIFKDIAVKVEENLDVVLNEYDRVDHDAGFIWLLSAGANYKFNGGAESRCRLLKAASFLASRFNHKGNFIRAWNGVDSEGLAIIDCCMNLPLLYWASNEIGDPRFRYIAKEHADTVLNHFIRDDGSVRHIVRFDIETGEYVKTLGGQGASPDSAWSRGTSWALYGLALAYKHLGDERYLAASKRVANFFIANLPDDMVAHWDFRVEKKEDTPRDTSATACAACGLLELSELVGGVEGANYKEKAYRIVRSLTDNYSNLDNDKDQALLFGATVHAPNNIGINVGLIYADYFYTEALSRFMGNKDVFWYSAPKIN